jgi:hypothetical protein
VLFYGWILHMVVRATLQGMIEVMALGFIGTWQTTRGQ